LRRRLKNIIIANLVTLTRLALLIRLNLQTLMLGSKGYQPNPFSDDSSSDPRSSTARFRASVALLQDLVHPSVIDVGCNQGYFTFKFAELGGICLGFDNDISELMIARARAALNSVDNVSFIHMTLTYDNIETLPKADIVVCLSVFHHWVRYYGKDKALSMLKALSEKAEKALIFDTGQPEEMSVKWSKLLGFMTPTGPEWIESQLGLYGFSVVRSVGTFSTLLSQVPRTLFVARRLGCTSYVNGTPSPID
jgi:SAM-dependent methyltransferase